MGPVVVLTVPVAFVVVEAEEAAVGGFGGKFVAEAVEIEKIAVVVVAVVVVVLALIVERCLVALLPRLILKILSFS